MDDWGFARRMGVPVRQTIKEKNCFICGELYGSFTLNKSEEFPVRILTEEYDIIVPTNGSKGD